MDPLPDSLSLRMPNASSRSLQSAQMELAARLLLDAFASDSSWQRRRVERLGFEGEHVKRILAVDVDLPSSKLQVPLPLALFSKDEAPINAQIRDEDDRALPSLTKGEAAAVGYIALRLAISEQETNLTAEDDDLLLDITMGSRPVSEAAYARLQESEPCWLADHVAALVHLLVERVVLFALLDSDGKRRIVRLSWTENVYRNARFATNLIGGGRKLLVPFHGLPSGSSHFEIVAPYGTVITKMTVLELEGTKAKVPLSGQTRLYIASSHELPTFGQILVDLRPRRSFLVIATAATSLMLLALLFALVFPNSSRAEAVLIGSAVISIAALVYELVLVRTRATSFARSVVISPLLAALVLTPVVGVLALARADIAHALGWSAAAVATVVVQFALLRELLRTRVSVATSKRDIIEQAEVHEN